MRESQAEIKAIEAQLRSIRADSSSSQRVPSTVLEPSSTHTRSRPETVLHKSTLKKPAPSKPAPSKPASANSIANSVATKRVESYPLPPKHRLPSDLEATVERLQEQSAFYIQQYRQLQSQSFQTPEQILSQALKILESQVQHINHLSVVQESAILELKTIAAQVEREWKAIERSRGEYVDEFESSPICEYVGTAVPQIEKNRDGIYVLSARSIDLFKAEREATLTAEALRHWANREKPSPSQSSQPSIWQRLTNRLSPSDVDAMPPHAPAHPTRASSPATGPTRVGSHPSRRTVRSQRRTTSNSVLRIKEAVALFLGAVIVRMVLDMLLVSFPVLWTPAVALLVTPAAIAVYRSSHTPQSGLVWGYRLLVIMLGLLLGGRL